MARAGVQAHLTSKTNSAEERPSRDRTSNGPRGLGYSLDLGFVFGLVELGVELLALSGAQRGRRRGRGAGGCATLKRPAGRRAAYRHRDCDPAL